MKKILLVLITVSLLTGCGSHKKDTATGIASTKTPTGKTRVKVERDECELETMNAKELIRGYGVGTSADQMTSRDIASISARNEIVNQVNVVASNMAEKFGQQHMTSGKGLTREDQGRFKQTIRNIAEESLKGARVICSNTYMVGDNYETHVCIELTNQDFAGKTYNRLANEEKLLIDYNADKFKEEMNKELERYRKQRGL
ncbi:MAG: hypothetical protein ACEPOV_13610 [Hyphomicrobiales bacterium]